MKKFKNILGLVFMLVITMLLLTACGQATTSTTTPDPATANTRLDQIKKNGKLVLATGNYRPFEYLDESNKMVGYDIDVAEAIAKKIGVPLEIKEMQFTSLIPTLQIDQADLVIAAMYITDERKAVVDFADPYMETGMVLVTRANDTAIKSTKDLDGKVVGVKAGATSEKVAQDLKDQGQTTISIKSYKETVDYLMDLEAGRTDASINDLLNQLEYNKTHPNVKIVGDPFTKSSLGIAVKKGDKELVDLINSVLKEMKQNGEKDNLYKKWLIKN